MGDQIPHLKIDCSVINFDLQRCNTSVEIELISKLPGGSLSDMTITNFLDLKPALKLEDFIHCQNFDGQTLKNAKLAGKDGKLKKT